LLHYIDGIVIIFVVLVISATSAVNKYMNELQFRHLESKQDDFLVTVRRNEGDTRISAKEVLVGDIVQLDTGSKIPAGLFSFSMSTA
jgi:P-type E1-E2 ATPase